MTYDYSIQDIYALSNKIHIFDLHELKLLYVVLSTCRHSSSFFFWTPDILVHVPEIVHVVLCNRHTFEIIHYTFNMKFNKDILRNLIYSYSSKLCNGLFRNWGRYHVGIDSFYVWHVNVLGILTSACDIVVAGGSVICIYLLWKQDVQVCICLLASNKSLYRLLKWSPMVYILPLLKRTFNNNSSLSTVLSYHICRISREYKL